MRKFVYLFLAIALAGCSEGVGLDGDVEGTYTLTTINGRSLPFTLSDFNGTREIVRSGRLRLDSNGDFTETVEVDVTEPGRTTQYTDRYTGQWDTSVNGEIILDYDDGDRVTGDVDGRDIILYASGLTIVYRR